MVGSERFHFSCFTFRFNSLFSLSVFHALFLTLCLFISSDLALGDIALGYFIFSDLASAAQVSTGAGESLQATRRQRSIPVIDN